MLPDTIAFRGRIYKRARIGQEGSVFVCWFADSYWMLSDLDQGEPVPGELVLLERYDDEVDAFTGEPLSMEFIANWQPDTFKALSALLEYAEKVFGEAAEYARGLGAVHVEGDLRHIEHQIWSVNNPARPANCTVETYPE